MHEGLHVWLGCAQQGGTFCWRDNVHQACTSSERGTRGEPYRANHFRHPADDDDSAPAALVRIRMKWCQSFCGPAAVDELRHRLGKSAETDIHNHQRTDIVTREQVTTTHTAE
jgi:hypothetical protein